MTAVDVLVWLFVALEVLMFGLLIAAARSLADIRKLRRRFRVNFGSFVG